MTDSKKIDDGGPAFPHMAADGHPDYRLGLTVRDWLAGQALVGIMSGLCSDHSRDEGFRPRAFNRVAFEDAAVDAYHAADAMIAARKGGEA